MENQKVVIKIIDFGKEKYVTQISPTGYGFQPSRNPFTDNAVLKLDLDVALDFAKKHNSYRRKIQVTDIDGNNLFNPIRNVINEEVQKFLINESYIMAGDNFNFTQPVKKVFFYNYSSFSTEFDVDVIESNISVTWQVSFWLNDMGIENFIIDVQKVEGVYVIELYDQHTDEMKQRTQKNIADDEWKFIVDEETTLLLGKTLYIKDLEFDFKNKSCKVNFQ